MRNMSKDGRDVPQSTRMSMLQASKDLKIYFTDEG